MVAISTVSKDTALNEMWRAYQAAVASRDKNSCDCTLWAHQRTQDAYLLIVFWIPRHEAGVGQHIYTGHEFDSDSDLTYAKARYYEQDVGRFLSQDPVFWEIGQTRDARTALLDPQLQNSYSYTSNDPIVRKDPTGRQYYGVNSGFAFPQCGCGPTGGFYVTPGTNDPIVYFGITVGPPGYTGSVTYSPYGRPTEGWSNSVSGFTNRGLGMQVGTPQNGSTMPSLQYGIGTPGISGHITYSIQLSKLLYVLGGPLESVTTPMTIGPNINNYNTQQNFSFSSPLIGGGSSQERATAVSAYNTSVGATTNESKLWTTPNGTVVTWSGQVISSAPQSIP